MKIQLIYKKSGYLILFLIIWGILTIWEYPNGGIGWPACYYHWFSGILTMVVLGIVGFPVVLAVLAYPYGGTSVSVCAFAAGGWILWLLIKHVGPPILRKLSHPRPRGFPTLCLILVTCVLFFGFVHVMTACVKQNPLPAPPFASSLNGGHAELIPKWKPSIGLSDEANTAFLDSRNTTLVIFLGQDHLLCHLSAKETQFQGEKNTVKLPFSPNTAVFFQAGKEVARCPLKPRTISNDLYLSLSDGDLYDPLWKYAEQENNEELKQILQKYLDFFL